MTISELQELDDDKLQRHFEQNARYNQSAPKKHRYSIRLGSNSLSASDTRELRDKFFKAVRTR